MSRGRRSNKLSFKCPAHESRGPARAAATLGLEPGTCHVATYTGFRGSPGGVRALCWNQEKPLSNSEWAPPRPQQDVCGLSPKGRDREVNLQERGSLVCGGRGPFLGSFVRHVGLGRQARRKGPPLGVRPPAVGPPGAPITESARPKGGAAVGACRPGGWGAPLAHPGLGGSRCRAARLPPRPGLGAKGGGPSSAPSSAAAPPRPGTHRGAGLSLVTGRPCAKGRVQRAAFARHLWSLAVDGQFPQRCCWKLLGAFRGGTEPVSGGQAADEARPASFPWGPRGTRERPQRLLRPTEAEASLRSFFWDVDALHDLLRPPHAHVGRHRPRSQGQQGGQRARGGRGPRQLGLLFWEKERRDSPRGRPAPHSACGGPRGPSEPRAGTGCGR